MKQRNTFLAGMILLLAAGGRASAVDEPGAPLPGTKPLKMGGDIASELVDGVDRFLLRQTAESIAKRAHHWKRDTSSARAYESSVEPNRKRLAHILGVRDARMSVAAIQRLGAIPETVSKDERDSEQVHFVSWPAFGDVTGEGLELGSGDTCVIVIPDADETPERMVGLVPGLARESQVARRLASGHCRVIIPALIDRAIEPRNGRARLTTREFLYRPAFELGRHLIGYEVQKVLALVDALERERRESGRSLRVGVFGHGEGGAVALYAAALDPRIACACVSGYFGDRSDTWRQPVDRNVFGLLDEFGDAEVASLIAPRTLIVEAARGPELIIPSGTGGAPGRLTTPPLSEVSAEVDRARALVAGVDPAPRIELVTSGADGRGRFGTNATVDALRCALDLPARESSDQPGSSVRMGPASVARLIEAGRARQARQVHEIDRHNQQLLIESQYVREKFMKKLDTKSLEAYAASVEPYRTFFADEVIGRFEVEPLPPEVSSRQIYDEPSLLGYEVVMNVFPDVIAYGILLVPKRIKAGERRPVVVCQHGLEGRPRDVADPRVDNPAYHRYAARLTERGFVTFAPQNLYLFGDRFRALQRKANPLKKTLFSVIVPQHQQITDWLATLPFVDPSRIAFYGLSYGGKSAMRIPPLVKNYSLSICSADFNEWVWKNASTRSPYSYVWSNEYEIFEFDLGSTFNYAEMAALIAPRPLMVERGHFDGVAPDEAVAYEFAKVFRLYDARLGIGDRCRIEYFVGPHTINGKGTFEFLHQHLHWPTPAGSGGGR